MDFVETCVMAWSINYDLQRVLKTVIHQTRFTDKLSFFDVLKLATVATGNCSIIDLNTVKELCRISGNQYCWVQSTRPQSFQSVGQDFHIYDINYYKNV